MANSSTVWQILGNYESHELVKTLYRSKHILEPNSGLTREIVSSFIQGRRYFEAASVADRAIKPLLLYYGVISLAKGMTLFLIPRIREATLGKGHGLSIIGWESVLSQPHVDIGQLIIKSNSKGTFVDLGRSTNNRNLNRYDTNAINQKTELGEIPVGTQCSLSDLFARLPDIIEPYKRWKIPACMAFSAENVDGTSESKITVRRSEPYINSAWAMDIVGGKKYCLVVSEDETNVVLQTINSGKVSAGTTDLIIKAGGFAGIGDRYLFKELAPNADFAKIMQLSAISYILSMLVRYHSRFWMDLIHQRIDDGVMPTLLATMDCLENLFPKIVIDFLEEKP